jgi:hypothetical protein
LHLALAAQKLDQQSLKVLLMKLSTLLLLLIVTAIAAFASLNWSAFIAPTELSLGFTTTQIPLGLAMLGLLALLTVLFLGFVVYLQGSALLETRRHSRELKTSRELADQAEASRFNDLRIFLEAELTKLTHQQAQSQAEGLEKMDQLERNLRADIEQSGNTVAAYIGELEDRLERANTPSIPAGRLIG